MTRSVVHGVMNGRSTSGICEFTFSKKVDFYKSLLSLCFSAKVILKTAPEFCPLAFGMIVLPALNILATTKMAAIAAQHKLNTSLAGDVIALVESHHVTEEHSLV